MRFRILAVTAVLLAAVWSTSRAPMPEAAVQNKTQRAAPITPTSIEPDALSQPSDQPPRVALLRQPGGTPPAPDGTEDSPADDAKFQFNLHARGTLFDFDGKPVPRGRIGFELDADLDRTPTAYCTCNANGEFDLPIGAGTWRVVYAGEPGHQGGRLALESVTIQDGAESAYFDFYLPGTRQIAGSVFREDQDRAHLVLEVFDLAAPEHPVATAYCSTNNASHEEYLASLSRDDDNLPPQGHSPGRGRFEISGLPPGHYQLRAYMDVGKRFYVWHDFDVTGSDYEFPPVAVQQRDFLAHAEIEY